MKSAMFAASLAALALSLPVQAQRGGGRGAQADQGPKVIEAQKLADNLYLLTGPSGVSREGRDPSGGNVVAFITRNGVIVVDSKNPGWGQPIVDKIKTLTDKPVTVVINTHVHGDHSNGQVGMPGMIQFIAQENTNINLRKTAMPRDERVKIFEEGDNAKYLPTKTFKDKLTIGSGSDRVELYYFGRGHTNGDAWVVFPSAHVMVAGDMVSGLNPPLVDQNNDGNAFEFPRTLAKAMVSINGVNTIVTGHSVNISWDEFKQYPEFIYSLLAYTQAARKAGKTLDEAAKEYKIPEKYTNYNVRYPVTSYMSAVYNELDKK